jgi:cation transport ATPase
VEHVKQRRETIAKESKQTNTQKKQKSQKTGSSLGKWPLFSLSVSVLFGLLLLFFSINAQCFIFLHFCALLSAFLTLYYLFAVRVFLFSCLSKPLIFTPFFSLAAPFFLFLFSLFILRIDTWTSALRRAIVFRATVASFFFVSALLLILLFLLFCSCSLGCFKNTFHHYCSSPLCHPLSPTRREREGEQSTHERLYASRC